jgi:triosephosphate isomerase
MKKIIIANWKMNNGFDEVDEWIEAFYKVYSSNLKDDKNVEVVLCPPSVLLDYIDSEIIEDGFHFLEYIADKQGRNVDDFGPEEIAKYVYESRPLRLGAQDCGFEESGQFTGDVSAVLLREVNCEYVIVGHSERRKYHYETNEIVAKKATFVAKNSMTAIICIGESKEIRDQKLHFDFVKEQLIKSIPLIRSKRIIVAYEPIWAIGTGETAQASQIEEMVNFIRKIYESEIPQFAEEFFVIYGGSVNSTNSTEILNIKGVDGLLVGKASLDIEEFTKILTNS